MYVLLVLWWLVCCIHAGGQLLQCKSSAWCDAGGGLAVARPAAVVELCAGAALSAQWGDRRGPVHSAAAAVTHYIQ